MRKTHSQRSRIFNILFFNLSKIQVQTRRNLSCLNIFVQTVLGPGTHNLRRDFESFCGRVFNLRSCHLRLTLGRAPLFIHIIGTERELRPCHPVQYLPIWVMDRTLAQPQVHLSWLRSNFLKVQTLYSNEVYIIPDSSESKNACDCLTFELRSPRWTVYNMESSWMLTKKDVNTGCGTEMQKKVEFPYFWPVCFELHRPVTHTRMYTEAVFSIFFYIWQRINITKKAKHSFALFKSKLSLFSVISMCFWGGPFIG
jgi:hypothetical protein